MYSPRLILKPAVLPPANPRFSLSRTILTSWEEFLNEVGTSIARTVIGEYNLKIAVFSLSDGLEKGFKKTLAIVIDD
jgi:hypothetical protein